VSRVCFYSVIIYFVGSDVMFVYMGRNFWGVLYMCGYGGVCKGV